MQRCPVHFILQRTCLASRGTLYPTPNHHLRCAMPSFCSWYLRSLGVAAYYIFGFGSGFRSAVSTFLQGTDLGLMEGRQHCHYAPGCLDISSFLEMRRFLLTSFVRFCPPSLPSKRGNKNLSQKVLLYIQRDYCQYRLRINVLGHELSPFCLSMLEFPRLLLGWKFGLIGTIRGYSGSKKLRARQAWYNGEIIDMFS